MLGDFIKCIFWKFQPTHSTCYPSAFLIYILLLLVAVSNSPMKWFIVIVIKYFSPYFSCKRTTGVPPSLIHQLLFSISRYNRQIMGYRNSLSEINTEDRSPWLWGIWTILESFSDSEECTISWKVFALPRPISIWMQQPTGRSCTSLCFNIHPTRRLYAAHTGLLQFTELLSLSNLESLEDCHLFQKAHNPQIAQHAIARIYMWQINALTTSPHSALGEDNETRTKDSFSFPRSPMGKRGRGTSWASLHKELFHFCHLKLVVFIEPLNEFCSSFGQS